MDVPKKNYDTDVTLVFKDTRNGNGHIKTDVANVTFGEIGISLMYHAGCVWFWSKSGDLITHAHVTNPVARRVSVEASRHGCLKGVNDSRTE